MAIAFRCPSCQTRITAKDEYAGRQARCKGCNQAVPVPKPSASIPPDDEVIDVLTVLEPPTPPSVTVQPAPPPPASSNNPFADLDGSESARNHPGDYRADRPIVAPRRNGRGGVGSVGGGLLMMMIAVVWFVGGLAAGYVFFYPPVLFVIGFIALVKGIIGILGD